MRDDGRREFEVEIENLNLPRGTVLSVFVDNLKAGEIVLDFMRGELDIDTNDGQNVPPVVNGSTVVVTDRAGATLLGGAFNATLAPAPAPGATPTPQPTPSAGAETRVRTGLIGARINFLTPKGVAEFRIHPGGSRKFKVQVEDVGLPPGTLLNVFVNQSRVGGIVLNSLLRGELEFNTNDGQPVPAIADGTSIALTDAAGATILAGTFTMTANTLNPILEKSFFVRQQYVDFLGRGPDPHGLNDWLGVLAGCANEGFPGAPATCDRTHVSSGFYRSREFLDSGYFAFRFYDAVLGRLPLYREFIPDMARVGGSQTDAEREVSKAQYIADFMQRPEFIQRYGRPTAAGAEAFVKALEQAAGITVANRATLISQMQTGAATPQQTLRAFIETDEITAKFFYRGFVAMQYFGYLRRDPEPAGYNDWVDVLTFGRGLVRSGDYRHLIQGFIYSTEYGGRFGQ
jgi:hypothetical protein